MMQVDQYLPPHTPALPHLKELRLTTTNNVAEFPDSVARVLMRLTSLILTDNAFPGIPESLTLITTLEKLDLSGNQRFQLHIDDIKILSGMPCLKALDISHACYDFSSQGLSQESVKILGMIEERFPGLSIQSNHSSEQEKIDAQNSMLNMMMAMSTVFQDDEQDEDDIVGM